MFKSVKLPPTCMAKIDAHEACFLFNPFGSFLVVIFLRGLNFLLMQESHAYIMEMEVRVFTTCLIFSIYSFSTSYLFEGQEMEALNINWPSSVDTF